MSAHMLKDKPPGTYYVVTEDRFVQPDNPRWNRATYKQALGTRTARPLPEDQDDNDPRWKRRCSFCRVRDALPNGAMCMHCKNARGPG